MFIPLGSDRPKRHIPWVTWGLIATNILLFIALNGGAEEELPFDPDDMPSTVPMTMPFHMHVPMHVVSAFADPFMLTPANLHCYQFISYQFLHADVMHVLGNMFFLYVFGPHVEDRLRPWGFAAFYLLGGVVAGLAGVFWSHHPILGASGSICAVTGAYLVLFPDTHIKFFVFYWYFNTVEVKATIVIALYAILDFIGLLATRGYNHMIGQPFGISQGTAYSAHIGGYLFGFTVAMVLLKTKILARERWDLLAMWGHYQRGVEYRFVAAQYEDKRMKGGPLSQDQQQLASARAAVLSAIAKTDFQAAGVEYRKLLDIDPAQVLNREPQQTLANHLMQLGQYELAAQAYENYLAQYKSDSQTDQITLLLALIYTRYLNKPPRAKELLEDLIPRLLESSERDLAQQLLAEANA